SGLVPMAIPVDGSPVDLLLHEVPVPIFDPVSPPPPDPGLGGAPAPQPTGATLRIATAPVPAREYRPYELNERSSGFTFGCYEPCRCALFNQNMGGGFALVPLTGELQGGPGPLGAQEWAMVDINTVTPPRSLRPVGHQDRFRRRFTGDGIYQWFPILTPVEGARPEQRLRARLTDSAQPPVEPRDERFDSGRVPVEVQWPRLDIAIADNEYVCVNRVLQISAKPGERRPIMMPAPMPFPSPIPTPPPTPPLR
ncbi:MAG TPA: hypothetical protein VEB22_12675, partial [Phycisphaerales bacterium]|nr:hypothetical protein [Phycisphaerales bacterium]